ncbi:MAG: hypothetical protein ACR2M6_00125 [Vampirovibrionia bacterium]
MMESDPEPEPRRTPAKKRSILEVYPQTPTVDDDGILEQEPQQLLPVPELVEPPEEDKPPEVEQRMDKRRKIKKKYIYVSAHSSLPAKLAYVEPVPGVEFVNLVEPDILCYNMKNQFVLEHIMSFSSISDDEREKNLKRFLHNMRFVSTTEHLRDHESTPILSDRATEQTFSFRKEKGTVLGIYDFDDIRADPFIVYKSSILGEELPDTGEEMKMTTEELRKFLMEKFPDDELVILLAGCRVTITPEREKQLRDNPDIDSQQFQPKRKEETTDSQLAESLALGLTLRGGKKKKKNKKTARSKLNKTRKTVKRKVGAKKKTEKKMGKKGEKGEKGKQREKGKKTKRRAKK